MRCIIYTRVSTDTQERDGTSLATQERACLDYARAQGWQVREILRDAASGFSLDRKGIDHVRQLLRQRAADAVLAYAVDRLSRNQNHIGILFDEVQSAEARLVFVTESFEDTAVGRFILSARAFVAEVEREKIVERTMRGKGERARSGRMPQGTGRGFYGYIYNRSTGRREVDPAQAVVIRRLFADFARGSSLVSLTNQLNAERVPTFSGSTWFPITVHRLLRNETYTGRTTYRRTSIVKSRDPLTGRKRRRTLQRDASEWIDVVDATPAIVAPELYAAVQAILDDPERTRRAQRLNAYPLTGRMRCPDCGHAMVGQALQRGRYRYYKCRRAYAGPREDRCSAGYVRADDLEAAVRSEVAAVLSNPAIILAEIERQQSPDQNGEERAALERQLESLAAQRRRLAKLYQLGEIDDAYLQTESSALKLRVSDCEARLTSMSPSTTVPRISDIESACAAVRQWFETAERENFELLLDALDIRIRTRAHEGELEGTIPAYAPTNSLADVCAAVGSISRVPFRISLSA
jgi:site-specific DNA recombinase